MDNIKISIAKDFSLTPGPRYIKEGDWSGEEFRRKKFFNAMNKAITENKKLIVDLDGTVGYGTSFLEEIFGGLIRVHNLPYDKIINHLELISNEEEYLKEDIFHYLKDAYDKTKLEAI